MTKIISATPATVNFGTVKPGSTATAEITIEATGTERVDVDAISETDTDDVFTNTFEPGYAHPEVTISADNISCISSTEGLTTLIRANFDQYEGDS